MVKNLSFTQHKNRCFIWVTITPETSMLTPRLLRQIDQARALVTNHALRYWTPSDPSSPHDITIGKIDVALDLYGSFIPEKGAYDLIKELL